MAIAFVDFDFKAGTGNSAGINTTGATLLVAVVSSQTVSSSNPRTDLDSNSNSWTRVGAIQTGGPFAMQSALYYVDGTPTVGSGHTFNDSAESTPAIIVLAFSGTTATSPLDQHSEAANQSSVAHAGSITPGSNNEVVILGNGGFYTTASVDGGFTLQKELDGGGGTNYAATLSYLIQTTATAANPGLTFTTIVDNGAHCMLASFKESGGGGGGDTQEWRGSYPPARLMSTPTIMYRKLCPSW